MCCQSLTEGIPLPWAGKALLGKESQTWGSIPAPGELMGAAVQLQPRESSG